MERKPVPWWRIPMLVVFIVIIVILVIDKLTSKYLTAILWRSAYKEPIVGIIADAVAIAGFTIALWARIILSKNWSASVTVKENHELIKRGPYSFVRHPIYCGIFLMFLGAVIWYGRVVGFVLLAAFFIRFWFKAIDEENLMMEHFPNDYPQYKKKVKALIPFVI